MRRVTLLTGPIRRGKTSWAAGEAARAGDWGGVLQPDGPHGRVFRNVRDGAEGQLEIENSGTDEIVRVGRFQFRAAAFSWANAVIAAAAADPACRTVLVDEVGPLELAGVGLADGVWSALKRSDRGVLLVVRRPLLEAVRSHFGLHDATTLDIEALPHAGHGSTGAP